MKPEKILYPTEIHWNAARKFVEIFKKDRRIMTILLTCSCARSRATKDSCLDLTLIIRNIKDKNKIKSKFKRLNKLINELKEIKKAGKFSHIDLSVIDGKIKPKERGWTDMPDEFELEIGNTFLYAVPLFDRDNYFKKLRKKYVPYYNEKLRRKRLKETKKFCLNNIEHIPLYVKRELYFHAFDRFYKATKEFMQALFIKNKVYPIAYNKWIKEQFVDILKRPDLYKEMVYLLEINKLESNELIKKADKLRHLFEKELV